MPVGIGDVIAGKYQVERVLGAGAMGVVVAARHLDLHELRAIKLMIPGVLADAEAVQRFLREARAAARLRSDHVAKIYDVGRLESGSPYIVLELLEGCDLKSLLQRERSLAVERVVRLVAQACDAVGEAHALGIVHRDLKLGNLFLTAGPRGEERVKVLDFGLAKLMEPPIDDEMTRTEAVLGTPIYMPPEQMRGARNADARSDVWALGVILYRLCTGRVPFPGSDTAEVYYALLTRAPEPPRAIRPEIPPQLEAVILRCLAREPAVRFASANELGAALSLLAGSPALAPPRTVTGTIFMGLGAPRGPLPSAPVLEASAAGRTDRATSWVQPAMELSTGAAALAEPDGTARRHPSGMVFVVAGAAVVLLVAMSWTAWQYLGGGPAAPVPRVVPAARPSQVPAATAPPASESPPPPCDPLSPTASATLDATKLPPTTPPTSTPPTSTPPTSTPPPVPTTPPPRAPTVPPPRPVPPVGPRPRDDSPTPGPTSSGTAPGPGTPPGDTGLSPFPMHR